MKKSLAFTLAEVTLTLGIVGIVASLTILPVVKNYQKKVYVNQLLKVYNDINTAFGKAQLNDLVDDFNKTSMMKKLPLNTSVRSTSLTNEQLEGFLNKLSEVLSVSKYHKRYSDVPQNEKITYKTLGGSNYTISSSSPVVYLKNGAILYIDMKRLPERSAMSSGERTNYDRRKNLGGKLLRDSGTYFTIDVNGSSQPNRMGRDLHIFHLGDDGVLYPWGGRDDEIYHYYENWEDYVWYSPNVTRCRVPGTSNGDYCAARIIDENWKMNY